MDKVFYGNSFTWLKRVSWFLLALVKSYTTSDKKVSGQVWWVNYSLKAKARIYENWELSNCRMMANY